MQMAMVHREAYRKGRELNFQLVAVCARSRLMNVSMPCTRCDPGPPCASPGSLVTETWYPGSRRLAAERPREMLKVGNINEGSGKRSSRWL